MILLALLLNQLIGQPNVEKLIRGTSSRWIDIPSFSLGEKQAGPLRIKAPKWMQATGGPGELAGHGIRASFSFDRSAPDLEQFIASIRAAPKRKEDVPFSLNLFGWVGYWSELAGKGKTRSFFYAHLASKKNVFCYTATWPSNLSRHDTALVTMATILQNLPKD